ncbi:sigma-70 family RNA polymerase sigma factor [Candidatus Poribacteria bacterium]|nr:sigma-70 family RNA polymerase sigma factor [Candidatus Poribacteria bacterium]MYG09224.1 sigma-70 family RNA polymerase sigma factor [Candidatus Poribacteria bacterium]MYK23199.1 sigma-70 family RNA polymerase sigma factor [Candidatus Poribacteria bacterium]
MCRLYGVHGTDTLIFRDDLLQIASITLFEKGPAFNPAHESRASFGTFIRPRICVSLTNARRKELDHHGRERLQSIGASDMYNTADAETDTDMAFMLSVPEPTTESFVDALIWDISLSNFERALPQLLNELTPREQQVFGCIREDMRNTDIAEVLHLSPGRVTQLVNQVEIKLKQACQQLGLIEQTVSGGV